MKITLTLSALAGPLAAVAAPALGRANLPILSNVLLEARDGLLHLTGTDLELEIRAAVPAESSAEGSFTVPAGKFLAIVQALPPGAALALEYAGERATLRSGSSRFALATLPADNFPAMDPAKYGEPATVPAAILHRLLDRTKYAMAQQDVRYYLNGLFLERAGGQLRAVASDGHRLMVTEAASEGPDLPGAILPGRAVKELSKLTGKADGEASLAIAPDAARVTVAGITLTTKTIEGRFPDWRRVVPTQFSSLLRVDRTGFLAALARVSVVSDEKYKSMAMKIGAECQFRATNTCHEEAEEIVNAEEIDGKPVSVGFNAAYLAEAASHLSGQTLCLEFTESANACRITDPEDDSTRAVVMPMRL